MIETIGATIAMICLFAIPAILGYSFAMDKVAKEKEKEAEAKHKQYINEPMPLFIIPEYEFKAMIITGKSLDDAINEINKLNNSKCLFLQIIETTTYPDNVFKVQMIILCRVEKEEKQ
jgi:hypothetical protein